MRQQLVPGLARAAAAAGHRALDALRERGGALRAAGHARAAAQLQHPQRRVVARKPAVRAVPVGAVPVSVSVVRRVAVGVAVGAAAGLRGLERRAPLVGPRLRLREQRDHRVELGHVRAQVAAPPQALGGHHEAAVAAHARLREQPVPVLFDIVR